MRQVHKLLLVSLLVTGLFGCVSQGGEGQQEVSLKTYQLDVEKGNVFQWPELDILEVTRLEERPQSLIKQAYKLKEYAGKYYIINGQKEVLVFDLNGQYLFTVGRQGKGPGEYLEVRDFCFSPDRKFINILDFQQYHVYSLMDGRFLESKKFQFSPGVNNPIQFAQVGVDHFYYWDFYNSYSNKDPDPDHQMLFEDNQGTFSFYMPFNGIGLGGYRFYEVAPGRYLVNPPRGQYTIYEISNEGIQERYRFEFAGKMKEQEYFEDGHREYVEMYGSGSPLYVWETPTHIQFRYQLDQAFHSALLDVQTGEVLSTGKTIPPFDIRASNDRFIAIIDFPESQRILEGESPNPFKEVVSAYPLTESSNPMIVKFNIKD